MRLEAFCNKRGKRLPDGKAHSFAASGSAAATLTRRARRLGASASRDWLATGFILLLFITLCTQATAEPLIRYYTWPQEGTLTSDRVNFRSEPSTSSAILGRFDDRYDADELIVTGSAEDSDGALWYKVVSFRFGEGWLHGDFLRAEEPTDAVSRLALKVRADYAISPSLAVKWFSEPMERKRQRIPLPDFNTVVQAETLVFHGHTAVYWDDRLQSVEIPAGFMGFGSIMLGTDAAEVDKSLGEPLLREGDSLVYAYNSDEITVTIREGGDGPIVTKLFYRRAIFE